MKNQLLEDLDDSQSRPPALPVRPVKAVPPPPAPPDATAQAAARQRAGVWRSRTASPAPPPLQAQAPHPGEASPRIEPQIASFSSREPDWTIPLPQEDPSWTERWGRKALGWTALAGVALAVAATAAWMVRETQVESTLAVVADHTPATVSVAAPAPPPAALAVPEPEPPPPLRMLPPEQIAAAPVAPAPAPVPEESPPPAAKPAAKEMPERRVAASAPVKRSRPELKKPAPRPARERTLARADTPPARRAPAVPPPAQVAPPPAPASPLAETLRLCRAAGYHATACIKRGCEATRFGLACRG